MPWSRELELKLAESCAERAALSHRRQAREYLAWLRREKALKTAAEQADTEARERPGYRADLDG
jgi:hypothetical protein